LIVVGIVSVALAGSPLNRARGVVSRAPFPRAE